jgi:hypothetical protein
MGRDSEEEMIQSISGLSAEDTEIKQIKMKRECALLSLLPFTFLLLSSSVFSAAMLLNNYSMSKSLNLLLYFGRSQKFYFSILHGEVHV